MYIKERLIIILLLFVMLILTVTILKLYNVKSNIIIYLFQIYGTVGSLFLIYDFIKVRKKIIILENYNKLDTIIEVDDIGERGSIEEKYNELINNILHNKNEIITSKENIMSDMQDYYAVWAHQIKTPISASNLLLQTADQDNKMIRELKSQLFKIDFYVDAVLNYLKLEDISSDYVFKEYDLGNMINKSVKKFSTQFICKKVSISIEEIDKKIYTDEKWFCFIVEQLISNCVKYTDKNGKVKIYLQETDDANKTILVIEDNGIGINKEDIPRIMDKGYTGFNGRMGKKSTGIGLYLCKNATGKLGIDMYIDSEVGVGTKVKLCLFQKNKVHE